MTNRKGAPRVVIVGLLSVFLFFTLFPMYFMLITSFKTNFQLSINYFGLPTDPQFGFMQDAFSKVWIYMKNTIFISGLSVIGVLIVSSLTAYVFARFRFPLKQTLFALLLAFLMIPGILMLVPQFVLVTNMGLINRPWAAILPYIAGGQLVVIFVFRTFFEEIPKELIESIRMDGGNELVIFFRLVLPLAIPIVLSMGLVNILSTWNDFIWPLLVLSDQSQTTLTVGLYRFMDPQQKIYGSIFSGMTIASIPLMALFAFTMKYFVQGMTSGAVKA
ncbi:carbohydrate ABC transporter permease [Cohnella nanjingensis]|uniref:Carbohydrate ABC transporter permease n=1 Tax=Cohnella nanjingensis TaxID=1387779 RepID=A0A7X0RLM4_9BACL|nr:carbohydrate ABC transporter permease [Cohnella nanjingensis]MBB6669783.1 carbohydrate ABC transporter permease [Cohnella nanjingensis]